MSTVQTAPRTILGVDARDYPAGTVLLNTDPTVADTVHAVVKVGHGWWAYDDQLPGPLGGDVRFTVLYVPGETPTVQRDRTAAVEGAAITLRAHLPIAIDRLPDGKSFTSCMCGYDTTDHPRHVAEQLAAVGALGNHAAVTERAAS